MEMNISLRPIDKDNWRECIKLKVTEEQKKFVGSNENSLAMCYVYPEINPFGIYLDNKIIGFITHALDPDDKIYYINRFMIDENYQGKGYGKYALQLMIEKLKNMGVKVLDILHNPNNHNAIKLYKSLGFELTDVKVGDDAVSTLKISAN
ncbi:MAG: GNAT family N-acetyltransferase [Bacteroidetes bacterium]|nr:GNAT family N-acetyltransferase [Bacteroidota bacterium]